MRELNVQYSVETHYYDPQPEPVMTADESPEITPADIRAAAALIALRIRATPAITVSGAAFGLPYDIGFKLELLQHSGSFKARGAFTSLMTQAIPSAGVVAASGGNHGAAVAYAARELGIPAKIFVPAIASEAKLARIRSYGAEVVVGGAAYADALALSEDWIASSGALGIHAYDQRATLMGQGTLGPEIVAQLPGIDTLLVAVGGGGLIGGLAAWFRGGVKLVGVETPGTPSLHAALKSGQPVDVAVSGLAADSLGARRVGRLMFPLAQKYVERVVLVEDAAIRAAQEKLWEALRLVAEPGGAAALAALTSGAYQPKPNERVGVLLCGGNTTAVKF